MKLPILELVATAYGAVLARPGRFIAAAIPALMGITAFWALLLVWEPAEVWARRICQVLYFLPYIVFALIWLRLYLAELPERPRPQTLRVQKSLSYLLVGGVLFLLLWYPIVYILPLGIVTFLQSGQMGWRLPAENQVYLAGLPLVPPWSYLLARVSLLAPAAAKDQRLALSDAWRVTAKNGLRLIVAYLLAGLPLLIAGWMVTATSVMQVNIGQEVSGRVVAMALSDIIAAPLGFAAVAVFVTVAAEAYRFLVGPGTPSTRGFALNIE